MRDPPTICLTPEADGWRHVFDLAGGDCAGGCTTHHEFASSTTAAGQIAVEAEWDSEAGVAMPDFIRKYGSRAGLSCYLR